MLSNDGGHNVCDEGHGGIMGYMMVVRDAPCTDGVHCGFMTLLMVRWAAMMIR